VRETVGAVRRLALAKDVELEEHYPEGPLLAPGTPSELRQASLGLVLTAVRAAGRRGSVCVRASSDHRWVALAVDTIRGGEGSLSLELSRAIARRLGGELVIDAEAGRGAILHLPAGGPE
jgi:signal transduction histidine kinase